MRLISHCRSTPEWSFTPAAHFLAQPLDVGGRGVAAIDEEVAVHLAHLRAAHDEPAAACGVDDLPRALRLGAPIEFVDIELK